MSDEPEPGTAGSAPPEKDLWQKQYEPKPAPNALEDRLEHQRLAARQNPPLLAPSASAPPSAPARTRSLALAFLAAAVVALLGALVWAGIVVATGYYIGFVAFFVGAATGLTAQRVYGAAIGGFERALAGAFAAGAVIVGNYVIVIHEVRTHGDPSLGYLDGHAMSQFVKHIGTFIHGFDWFWIALAAFAAIRTTGGVRRTRS